MKHFLLISAFIFFCCATLHAQNRYFPLNGMVVSADSLSPIPNAHILSELSYYGTTSNSDGRFSMLIRNNDTLRISNVGFVTQLLPINYDSINSNNYLIMMEKDTIMLQEVDVFPYLDNHKVEEIIGRIPIEIPKLVLYEDDININVQNYYYNKTKDIPKVRFSHNYLTTIFLTYISFPSVILTKYNPDLKLLLNIT